MPTYIKRRALTPEEQDMLPGFSPLMQSLLFHRGVIDQAAARSFISPDYDSGSHDPMLLKGADEASARIIRAIENGEKIGIYADYDADGIPGAALFHDLFARIGYKDFVIYIPHRHNEGFGVNESAIGSLAAQGVKLLITVDCGISDREAIEHARKLGMEVIITDHHEPPSEMPPAIAVVDPKQEDCAYPDKNLCGTGVAYKLIQAILSKNRFGLKDGHEKWMLDLVGIATLSDMVPLVGENRVLAHYGLQVLRKTPRKGLRKLFSKLRMSQPHLTEDDIAFMVTPRINAASRMGVPMDAFKLLVAESDAEADAQADHLDAINSERKGVVASLVKEVKKILRERHTGHVPSVIVLGNPDWRPSLLGLAANSCAEEFRRPVFLWGRDGEGALRGSCRSEGATHMVELMRGVPAGIFVEFGGHKHSGGFSVKTDSVHHLERHLVSVADGLIRDSGQTASAAPDEGSIIDHELCIDDIGGSLSDDISKLAPFGVGNRKPLFLFKGVSPESVRRFGKANDHVELIFTKTDGRKISAISFFGAESDWAKAASPGKDMDLIASVEKSVFRNRPEIRLRIVDVIYS